MSDFILPDIGEGIVECEVVEWRVSEGDDIVEEQPVVEVMTDKALVEITAPEAGRVTRLYVAKGEIAKVHAPLFAYDGTNEEPRKPSEEQPDRPEAPPSVETPPISASVDSASITRQEAYRRTPASPAVRQLLREHGLSLTHIRGSGKQGRVLREDVMEYLDQVQQADAAAPARAQQPGGEEAGSREQRRAEQPAARIEPIRGIRAVMARRMVETARSITHIHYCVDIDVSVLLAHHELNKS